MYRRLGFVLVLIVTLAAAAAPAAAQDDGDDGPPFQHPVVTVFQTYFTGEFCVPDICNSDTCNPEICPSGICDPAICGPEICDPEFFGAGMAEGVAAYHEDGIGFGVLVKLYAIAAENAEEGEESVTVEELVELFQSGTGLGELFDEYGRPSLRGVGHLRKATNGPPERAGRPDHAGPKKPKKPK